ncbi:TPA: ribonuclease III [bacterium]|nr:ribonuclease III [bacterium]
MQALYLKDMVKTEKMLNLFQEKLGVSFSDTSLLRKALTHSSYSQENNERLCFLGDAILGMVTAEYLFNKFPNYSEGDLTKLKSELVGRKLLFSFAKKIDIGRFIFLSSGESATGGRKKQSILSEALEAVIGAIFIDCGMNTARDFIINYLNSQEFIVCDYKSDLQELTQKKFGIIPSYRLIEQVGKDHKPTFTVEANVCGMTEKAKGGNKKEAEQNASKKLLDKIKCKS